MTQHIWHAMELEGAGVSLGQAIRDKYSWEEEEEEEDRAGSSSKAFNETALSYRPGSCPLQKLKVVVLERKKVSGVEDVENLTQLCPKVQELHLSFNHITQNRDITHILSAMPSLKLLDLCYNPLNSSTFVFNGQSPCTHLSTLVLNGTAISWEAVEVCLMTLNQLQELHLSVNTYTTVDLPQDFLHSQLQRLYLNDNQISVWEELAKLSPAFPNLRALIACNNPIQQIPSLTEETFSTLQTLNLNSSCLCSWQSILHLATLRQLEDLSMLKAPVGEELEPKKRRFAFIARLPRIVKLNKSNVSDMEREDAERWMVREWDREPDPPSLYHQLVQKHGPIQQLADVDLNPPKIVMLKFLFEGDEERGIEEAPVDMDKRVGDLKAWVADRLLGMPTTSFKLWYFDKLLKPNQKFLYTYRFAEGDTIHIQMK